MGEKVSVLVNRAALHRHSIPDRGNGLVEPRRAVDDEEFGTPQPALDEIVQHRAPGLGTLAAHALDREQHLLAIVAHAEDNQQRDRGRLAVEPHANDGAVEYQPYRAAITVGFAPQPSESADPADGRFAPRSGRSGIWFAEIRTAESLKAARLSG